MSDYYQIWGSLRVNPFEGMHAFLDDMIDEDGPCASISEVLTDHTVLVDITYSSFGSPETAEEFDAKILTLGLHAAESSVFEFNYDGEEGHITAGPSNTANAAAFSNWTLGRIMALTPDLRGEDRRRAANACLGQEGSDSQVSG